MKAHQPSSVRPKILV